MLSNERHAEHGAAADSLRSPLSFWPFGGTDSGDRCPRGESSMQFDPATCIHCDPVGDSLGGIIMVWLAWLVPAVALIIRRRIMPTGWPKLLLAGLLNGVGVAFSVAAALVSVLWLLGSH